MLSAERLRELLHYDPCAGLFTWLISPNSRVRIGDVAGHQNPRGYLQIKIDGKTYQGHRLSWLYMIGEWPEFEIDHRDTNPSNNRWDNLRPADGSGNSANTKRRSNNRSGFKGVVTYRNKRDKKYGAKIVVRGRIIFLGYHHTAQAAHEAYAAAAREHFGEFARSA